MLLDAACNMMDLYQIKEDKGLSPDPLEEITSFFSENLPPENILFDMN